MELPTNQYHLTFNIPIPFWPDWANYATIGGRLPDKVLAEQAALERWPVDGDWWQKMRMGLCACDCYN